MKPVPPHRNHGLELLDNPAADPALVRESLRNIARSNRWFGGRAAARYGLRRLLEGAGAGPFRLFDIGTGLGDLPAHLHRWGASRGLELQVTACDLSPTAAALATARGVPTAVSCASALPLADGGADIVLLSQVLHHFNPASAVRLLRECRRVARIGLVVTDLARSRLAQAGFWLGATVLRFDRHTRRDGVTSLQRGYDGAEFPALFAGAGLQARIYRRPRYRLVAVCPAR